MSGRRSGVAIGGGVITAVLWQLTGEIPDRMIAAGGIPPQWLPVGTSFPLSTVLDLVPNAGLFVLGLVLSLVLVDGLVGLGIRVTTRRAFDGVRSFLAVWMVVVLAAVLADLLTQPIIASYGGAPFAVAAAYRGAYWGVAVGWIVAAVVALGSRRGSAWVARA